MGPPDSAATIPVAEPDLGGNELDYVTDCIRSGWVSSGGAYVERFELAVAEWCGVRHAVAASSGTSALHLALASLGIGPGDEVIVPALSYVASANAVTYTGARPVFVDVDADTWNLDIARVESRISARTRAIMPVHLYGYPVDMERLLAVARKAGVWVIEDACEALGSECSGRRVGGLGDIGCLSFYGNKLVTTGEGGMLLTNSGEVAVAARELRNQAMTGTRYWHARLGFSYRLTNLQAAVGLAQMERVEEFVEARRRVASKYGNLLCGTPGLRLYREPAWSRSVPWLYSLLVTDEFVLDRDGLIAHLAACGIESKPFFMPLPRLPMYDDGTHCPVSEDLSRRGISLPTFVLMETQQIERVARAIRDAGRSTADVEVPGQH
jgi:perosamine synthetase